MAATPSIYPIRDSKDIFKALNVLKPDFDISEHEELYVDFDGIRSEASFEALMINLGILNNEVNEGYGNAKILYTGHTGCGKSTELVKLHHKLNTPKQYFSIYINIEDYIEVSDFESGDFIVVLTAALVNALQEHEINYAISGLQKIENEWLAEKEVSEEIRSKIGTEATVAAEVSTGWLLKFFSLKTNIKSFFSFNSQTSTNIRRKISQKPGEFILALKESLLEIKNIIKIANKGKEIVFIVDGLERLRLGKMDTFTETFFQNNMLVRELNCSMICCVPIDSMYDSKMSLVLSTYTQHFTLPLIAIGERSTPLFSQIITKRIDEDTFFEQGVLEYCVSQSGGSPRQLLRIVYTSLTQSQSNNFKIRKETAEKVCRQLGADILHRLTTPDLERLNSGDYQASDPLVLDMLFSLALMEYNGSENKRKPNPLLLPFLKLNA